MQPSTSSTAVRPIFPQPLPRACLAQPQRAHELLPLGTILGSLFGAIFGGISWIIIWVLIMAICLKEKYRLNKDGLQFNVYGYLNCFGTVRIPRSAWKAVTMGEEASGPFGWKTR